MPGWAIDLIRDGVSATDLRDQGQRSIWDALGRTALAAVNAGHSRAEWEYEVTRPASRLGAQNRLKAAGKERTPQAANKSLNSAWDRAQRRAAESPAWTRETVRQQAVKRANALRIVVADADIPLTDPQRVLLEYAANTATRQGSVSVNLPRAATARATGLGEKSVRLHLDRLVDHGMLNLTERGRSRTKTRPGKANVYRLPDEELLRIAVTYLSRETRQVGPTVQAGRPQVDQGAGPTCGEAICDRTAAPVRLATPAQVAAGMTIGQVREKAGRAIDAWAARTLASAQAG